MAKTNTIIQGGTDSGKSEEVKEDLIPELRKTSVKCAILDPEDEYKEKSDARVEDPGQFDKAFRSGEQVVRWSPDLSLIDDNSEERNWQLCNEFIAGATAYEGYVVLIIEEAHNFQRNTSGETIAKLLKVALKQGQKYGVTVVQVSQSPQDFHRHSWENSGLIISFRLKQVPKKFAEELDSSDPDPTQLKKYWRLIVTASVYEDNYLLPPLEI